MIKSGGIRFPSYAIVGGGFSGLAVANYLVNTNPDCVIDIFDSASLPGRQGASAIAGGLLHPFTPKGKLIWGGLEGYEYAFNLIESCEEFSSESLYSKSFILRPFIQQDEVIQWNTAANQYPEMLEIISKEKVTSVTGNHAFLGGALFRKSLIVNPPVYLAALWHRIQSLSPKSSWLSTTLSSDDLIPLYDKYSAVVLAAGPGIRKLWPDGAPGLPFKYVKGQNLLYKFRDDVNHKKDNFDNLLEFTLLKGEYIAPEKRGDMKSLVCGASHEYFSSLNHINDDVDIDKAIHLLSPKLMDLYPNLNKYYQLSGCTAGIRVMSERTNLGKVPIIARHPKHSSLWMIGGLGARGLIHHAYVANKLVLAIINGDINIIPNEMRLH